MGVVLFSPGKSPGSRSGHSATSLPTGSTGKASATTYPARGDTDFLELVIDAALPLPLYWATRDGVHIFPDPNRIGEIQRLMTDTWPMMSLVSVVVALIPVDGLVDIPNPLVDQSFESTWMWNPDSCNIPIYPHLRTNPYQETSTFASKIWIDYFLYCGRMMNHPLSKYHISKIST